MKSSISHGTYLSVAFHAGLVLALTLGIAAPPPFAESSQEVLEVEVVPLNEAAEEPKPEHSPSPDPSEAKQRERPSQSRSQPQAQSMPTASGPAPDASLAPSVPPPPSSFPAQPAAQGMYSVFDPASIAALYNLKPPSAEFDAASTEVAKLTNEEIAAFRAQLRRCWQQPAGVAASSRARVLMRVSFTPDGRLAAEPGLIEASASRDGPLVYKAALQALSRCQPFSTLPRERYQEWKTLDVTFSALEMSGG